MALTACTADANLPPASTSPTSPPAAGCLATPVWRAIPDAHVHVEIAERLEILDRDSTANLRTEDGAISGFVALRPDGTFDACSRLSAQLNGLHSEDAPVAGLSFLSRDQAAGKLLDVLHFATADFVPETQDGLTMPLEPNGKWPVAITGKLSIRGVARTVTFRGTLERHGNLVTTALSATLAFADFAIPHPEGAGVISVADAFTLTADFAGEEVR